MSKKSKNSYRKQYPCINCSQDCEGVSSILCYGCGKWVHSKCIGEGISEELTKRWSARGLKFYCPGCCFDGDEFDMKSSLLRLRINPKKEIAESEKLLLETYGILLPAISEPSSSLSKDNVSVSILKRFHPVTLEEFRPLATYGDGNCLYRSVSQGLFGSQDYHVHLRLLAAIEIIANKSSYDTTAVNYIDKMMDNRIIVPQYNDIVDSACSLDAFSELIHMYAISAAIKLPVRSYYPPMISSMFHSQPFSRIVVGRGVKTTEPTVTVMWTCTVETKTASQFRPNHFVTLVRRRPVETVFLNVSNESEGSFLNTPNQSPETSPLHSTPVRSSQFSRKEASPQKEDSLYDVKHCTLGLSDTSGNRYACLSSSDDDPEPLDDIKISETNSYSDSKSNGKLYHGKFLDLPSTIELLTDNCIPSLERVPSGKKENEYFLVDNSANARRRQESRKNVFWDDCGVWESKNGAPKQLFVRNGHAFSSVVLKNELYCYEKQIAKQRQYIPLDPQPSDVITVHRCYAVLKKDKTYRKRVTWMDSYNDRAIYEYIGDFPGRQEHGNNKNSQRRYIRTPAETLEKIADEAKYQYPTNVYDDMAVNDSTFGPRDVKQIKNKKYTENVKEPKTSGNLNNFADNIQVIENIVHTSSFVQMVINCKSKVPSVICYTEEQLQDMKRFCSVPNGTLLGFDKTFNLTDIHVTVAVFKNRSVRKHETKENPIFFGPFFFHGNSDESVYNQFMSELARQFSREEQSNLIIGSDEELALRNSIHRNFPFSTTFVCSRHLKNNVKRYLADKIGISEGQRQKIIVELFGDNGVWSEVDPDVIKTRMRRLESNVMDQSGKFAKYLSRVEKLFLENCNLEKSVREKEILWTNNNCESSNFVLKVKTSWKQLKLKELIDKVHNLVQSRYVDVRKALTGRGQYYLDPCFQHRELSYDEWIEKSTDQRQKIFKTFMKDQGRKTNISKSTDGKRYVPVTPSGGKKPHQSKRKRAERTVTVKKRKT